jgi:hypothetical protein
MLERGGEGGAEKESDEREEEEGEHGASRGMVLQHGEEEGRALEVRARGEKERDVVGVERA